MIGPQTSSIPIVAKPINVVVVVEYDVVFVDPNSTEAFSLHLHLGKT